MRKKKRKDRESSRVISQKKPFDILTGSGKGNVQSTEKYREKTTTGRKGGSELTLTELRRTAGYSNLQSKNKPGGVGKRNSSFYRASRTPLSRGADDAR